MNPQKLRLGILLDSFDVPAWVEDAVHRVVEGNSGEFILVILNSTSEKPHKNNGSTIVYSIFNQIDEKLFTKEPNPFAKKVSLNYFPIYQSSRQPPKRIITIHSLMRQTRTI